MIPRDNSDKLFSRDARQILRASEIGIRWADNIGPVLTMRYLASRAPYQLRTVATLPFAVLCLRAVSRTTNSVESGCRVTWSGKAGSVLIEAIDVSDTAAVYDVTLGVLMG